MAAPAVALPDALRESSGVAVSRHREGVFWTHGDSDSRLYAVDAEGRLVMQFETEPRLRDWEDIATADCADGGRCLYLADLGDNDERQGAGTVGIVRLREPAAGEPRQESPATSAEEPVREGPATAVGKEPRQGRPAGASAAAAAPPIQLVGDVFPVRLPDGPRDIEALLVFPDERVYVVSKGRNHAITVYRYPPPLRPDTVNLEEVQRLSDGPRFLARQVTGGSVAPDGQIAALRTYESLQFYRLDGDTLAALEDGLVNLRTLQEAQGEGVGLGRDGLVALTSEGGPLGGPASLTLLRCRPERLQWPS